MKRSYREMLQFQTFEDRFGYLDLVGQVGDPTFGYTREFNQHFYHSSEWRRARQRIILRDNGCDLGMPEYEIHGHIYVHHINPITLSDIEGDSDILFDPDNLVCVSFATHNAIHYGNKDDLPKIPIERRPGDTCPWR